MSDEFPLLTREEDANDFQLKGETLSEKDQQKIEDRKAEEGKKKAEKETLDLPIEENKTPASAPVKSLDDLKGRSKHLKPKAEKDAIERIKVIAKNINKNADTHNAEDGIKLSVGDRFSQIKDSLPKEDGQTPLFTKKYNSISEIISDLAEIFNKFPNNITAADDASILIKNPDNGKTSERLKHLITQKDENNGARNTYSIYNKIPWLPRTVETLENAQAKLKDPKTGNYAYVRAYNEGIIHTVFVTKAGVIQEQETFDHGLITQFAERFIGRRGLFEVIWERKASKQKSSPQTASHMESSGKFPRPFRQGKHTPDSDNVKPSSEKNPKIFPIRTLCQLIFRWLKIKICSKNLNPKSKLDRTRENAVY